MRAAASYGRGAWWRLGALVNIEVRQLRWAPALLAGLGAAIGWTLDQALGYWPLFHFAEAAAYRSTIILAGVSLVSAGIIGRRDKTFVMTDVVRATPMGEALTPVARIVALTLASTLALACEILVAILVTLSRSGGHGSVEWSPIADSALVLTSSCIIGYYLGRRVHAVIAVIAAAGLLATDYYLGNFYVNRSSGVSLAWLAPLMTQQPYWLPGLGSLPDVDPAHVAYVMSLFLVSAACVAYSVGRHASRRAVRRLAVSVGTVGLALLAFSSATLATAPEGYRITSSNPATWDPLHHTGVGVIGADPVLYPVVTADRLCRQTKSLSVCGPSLLGSTILATLGHMLGGDVSQLLSTLEGRRVRLFLDPLPQVSCRGPGGIETIPEASLITEERARLNPGYLVGCAMSSYASSQGTLLPGHRVVPGALQGAVALWILSSADKVKAQSVIRASRRQRSAVARCAGQRMVRCASSSSEYVLRYGYLRFSLPAVDLALKLLSESPSVVVAVLQKNWDAVTSGRASASVFGLSS